MTFLEVAASGKAFRRPGWKHWLEWNPNTGILFWDHGCAADGDVRLDWIMAEDWELAEQELRIKESDIDAAWDEMLKDLTESPLNSFKKKLGFR